MSESTCLLSVDHIVDLTPNHKRIDSLEVTAFSVQGKTTVTNQRHYQCYFQGTDAHESKPPEEVPSHLCLQSGTCPFWPFFRSQAAGFGVIISRKLNWELLRLNRQKPVRKTNLGNQSAKTFVAMVALRESCLQ